MNWRTGWIGAALALVVGMEASAAAQGVLSDAADTCVNETFSDCDTPGTRCGDDTGLCVTTARSGEPFCLGDGLVMCCAEDSDCPAYESADGTWTSYCTEVDGLGGASSLCLAGPEYCGSPPTVDQVRRCHSTRTGERTLRWANGDCDADGTPNAVDAELFDECEKPEPRGYWTSGNCTYIQPGCAAGTACRLSERGAFGSCAPTEDENGTRCAPSEEVLYCGGPEFACPRDLEEVWSEEHAQSFCVPDECGGSPDVPSLLDCVVGSDGDVTLYSLGDCDGDELPNGVDPAPCDAPATPDDAGVGADAGANLPADAGSRPAPRDGGDAAGFDGGAPNDPGVQASFEGGGGCACRAAPGRTDPPLGVGLFALGLGLALARRRGRAA